MRQEAKLSKQFMDAFERFAKSEVCIHKVSDNAVSYGMGDARQQFSNPRAVDYLGVWRGRGLAIEFKYEKGTSMAFSKVRDDQKKFLTEFANAGGIALVAIFWETPTIPAVLEVCTADVFVEAEKRAVRKSVPNVHSRCLKMDYVMLNNAAVIEKNQRNNQSWDLLAFEKLLESQPEYKREPF